MFLIFFSRHSYPEFIERSRKEKVTVSLISHSGIFGQVLMDQSKYEKALTKMIELDRRMPCGSLIYDFTISVQFTKLSCSVTFRHR
jgi:hypothetical protein